MEGEPDWQFDFESLTRDEEPEMTFLGNSDAVDSEDMDEEIRLFIADSRRLFAEQETLQDWQKEIVANGALQTIKRELLRGIFGTELIRNDLDKLTYGRDILDGFAYGLFLGSKRFESGSVIPKTPEVGKILIKTAETYSEVGMTTDSDELWGYYESIENDFYSRHFEDGGPFKEVQAYAEANMYSDESRSVFMTAAAIGLKLYEDASILRRLNQLYENS